VLAADADADAVREAVPVTPVTAAVPFPAEDVAELEAVEEPDGQEGAVFTSTFWSLHRSTANFVVATKSVSLS
jgi:hypothetical protein